MRHFLHRQQRNSTCAVAAIRTVLHWQFGVRLSESALVALGTDIRRPIVSHGSDVHDMRRTVREASIRYNGKTPWTLRVRRRGTLGQLRYWTARGRWPIVQVFQEDSNEHHAVVVVHATGEQVCVFDPDPSEKGKLRWIERDAFLAWWLSPVTGERWWSVVNGGELVTRPPITLPKSLRITL